MYYADATVFWDEATMYSQFIPGAILYSIKSLPDVISELEDVAKTAISNNAAYQKLVSSLLGLKASIQLHQDTSAAQAALSHAHISKHMLETCAVTMS